MDIGKIVGEYIYLKPLGEDHVGRCPFCFYHQPSLLVITQLKMYECVHCRVKGGALHFIRQMETIIAWDYQRSLKGSAPKHQIGTVYVLSLVGGRYYVGFTQDLKGRLKSHFKHQGAEWTKKHPPLQLVDVYYDVPEFVEHRVTKRYIERFGTDKVRGGWYLDTRDTSTHFLRYPSKSPYFKKAS